jgi:alcohol dehydrogenase
MLPLIAIPTTAGTGSECQSFALIADESTHQKMACGDKKALTRIAILDATLTVTQPTRVTACTGLDAVAHAVESAVCTKRNNDSIDFSHHAFALTHTNLPAVLQQPDDLTARGNMLYGASLAGMAIERSMLGAAHSCANPLTAHYNMTHGTAVGMMLPHIVRFNAENIPTRDHYNELAVAGGLTDVDELIARLEYLLILTDIPRTLKDANIPPSAIPELADEAARQWTAQFNPRPVSRNDFSAIYEAAR